MRANRDGRGLGRDDRGTVLVIAALAMVVVLGMAALAIDVGSLMAARSEAQRAADAAALAGAGSLIHTPGDEDVARANAIDYGGRNVVQDEPVVLEAGDVDVDLAELEVTARVQRTEGRGNPIPTVFARVLNIDAVDVGARAVAKAIPAGSANCLLPVAVADNWVNVDDDPGFDEEEGDFYSPCSPGDADCTGYLFPRDHGEEIQLKPAQGNSSDDDVDQGGWFEPGWWYLWQPGGTAAHLSDWVNPPDWPSTSCPDPEAIWGVGDDVTDKNGNTQSIVRAFEDLIALDPGARWDANCQCLVGSAFEVSPRVRTVALFDPTTYVKTGSNSNFTISNLVGVFVDRVDNGPPGQRGVWVRFVPATGTGEGEPGGGGFLRRVVLVE